MQGYLCYKGIHVPYRDVCVTKGVLCHTGIFVLNTHTQLNLPVWDVLTHNPIAPQKASFLEKTGFCPEMTRREQPQPTNTFSAIEADGVTSPLVL